MNCKCGISAQANISPTSIIHPTAKIHPTAVIGGDAQWRGKETKHPVMICEGVIVGPLSQIDAGCERYTCIGSNTWIMGMVHVGHGVHVGQNCTIPSGTVLGGETTIGNNVRMGVGVHLKPYITVGDGARIGMGSVVLKDVPAYECWAGNPAKFLYKLDPQTGEKIS